MSIRPQRMIITRDNIYGEMSVSEESRRKLLEFSIRDPMGYKLRLFKELVEDAPGVVQSYLDLTEGLQEKVQAIVDDRLTIAKEILLNLSEPLPTSGFDSRILEILNLITPQSIDKMARAYRLVLQTVNPGVGFVPADWKAKVVDHLNNTGAILSDNWAQEAVTLAGCKNSEDVVKSLVQGRVISRIQGSPISDASSNAFALQESRMKYIQVVLLTAALHIHIIS